MTEHICIAGLDLSVEMEHEISQIIDSLQVSGGCPTRRFQQKFEILPAIAIGNGLNVLKAGHVVLSAGLPYFHPHSFRNTLVQPGQHICKTPEQFKAWSQNIGHEKVLSTF